MATSDKNVSEWVKRDKLPGATLVAAATKPLYAQRTVEEEATKWEHVWCNDCVPATNIDPYLQWVPPGGFPRGANDTAKQLPRLLCRLGKVAQQDPGGDAVAFSMPTQIQLAELMGGSPNTLHFYLWLAQRTR